MKTIKINNVEVTLTKEQLEEALKEFDKPKFDYPICCKSKQTGEVVVFTGMQKGEVLKVDKDEYYNLGYKSENFHPHTNKTVWEEIPYDRERGFYHKQPVYCWCNEDTHSVTIRFYNALTGYVYAYQGSNMKSIYDNYSTTLPEHMKEFGETR